MVLKYHHVLQHFNLASAGSEPKGNRSSSCVMASLDTEPRTKYYGRNRCSEVRCCLFLHVGSRHFCNITASLHTEILPVVIPYGIRCLRTSVTALRALTGFANSLLFSLRFACFYGRSALPRCSCVTRDQTAVKTAKV